MSTTPTAVPVRELEALCEQLDRSGIADQVVHRPCWRCSRQQSYGDGLLRARYLLRELIREKSK